MNNNNNIKTKHKNLEHVYPTTKKNQLFSNTIIIIVLFSSHTNLLFLLLYSIKVELEI